MNKEQLFEQIEAGMEQVFHEESFTEYLKVMASFHAYSLSNTMLIAMQKPEATYVAGFHDWRKKYGRMVNKGEKAIWIIAPMIVKKKETDNEDVHKVVRGFRRVPVFDVSQTHGDPLPDPVTKTLTGKVEDSDQLLETLTLISPAPVSFEHINGEAKGCYNPRSNEITIQEGMPQAQTIKTLIHEMAHAILHGADDPLSRQRREYEAESTAYTVCQHYGIDASSYSFPYLALWAKDMDLEEKKASMGRILNTADTIITKTDAVRYPLFVNAEKKLQMKPVEEILELD